MCTLHVLDLTKLSLRKWLVSREDDLDNKALMAEDEAVESKWKEHEELDCKGQKRKSSEQHHYDQAVKTAIGRYTQYIATSEQF